MFEEIENRLRRAHVELTSTQAAEERALRVALADLPNLGSPAERAGQRRDRSLSRAFRLSRRRDLGLVATVLAMVAVGLAVWALLPSSTDSSSSSVLGVAGGSDRFPSESLTDWVSYSDQVSIVSVLSEEALPAEVIEPGDSYVPRAVTLRVEETIWRREGAPVAAETVRVVTFGWAVKDGERRPVTAWGGPRLEVGSRYVAPLVRAPRDGVEWTPLSLSATLPLDGNVISITGIVGLPSQIAKDMTGKNPGELADILAHTSPDPIAAKYFHLPPDERWEAVLWETRTD